MPDTRISPHEVHVVDSYRRRAKCTCDWEGRPRVSLARAKQDGWDHTAMTRHMPADPYVVDPRKALAR